MMHTRPDDEPTHSGLPAARPGSWRLSAKVAVEMRRARFVHWAWSRLRSGGARAPERELGLLAVGLAGVALANLVAAAWLTGGVGGADFRVFVELGHRWLATGTTYMPYQIAAPYSVVMTSDITQTPGVYPPAAWPLFVAVALLPLPVGAVLWWGVPIVVVLYAVRRWRPAAWAWSVMAALLAWPHWAIWNGGTSMWITAAVAAGLLWRWPAALILLKPTFAPLALIGTRDRRWWIMAAVLGVLTFVGPWRDYIAVVLNATDSGGFAHSLQETPMVLMPVVAWIGRSARAISVDREGSTEMAAHDDRAPIGGGGR